jgi:hypothetical protein
MCIQNDKLYTANGYYGLNIHNLVNVTSVVPIDTPTPNILTDSYPNPFRSFTNLTFNLPKNDLVKIRLYNIKGQLVRELCDEYKKAGSFTLVWDGTDSTGKIVPAGVYVVSYRFKGWSTLKRITRM